MTEKIAQFGLHRSIHPNYLHDNKVGQEAFSPTKEESYKLSVDCEKVWKAKSCYEFRTITLGKSSAGIWTLPRDAYLKLGLNIEVDEQPGNSAHSLVVFPANDRPKRRDIARRLAALANDSSYSLIDLPLTSPRAAP
jgi:hypothetical protein